MQLLKHIEERRKAVTSRRSGDMGYIVFDSSIGVMQLKDKLMAARDSGREVAVTGFNPSSVRISCNALPDRAGCRQSPSEDGGCDAFSFAPELARPR